MRKMTNSDAKMALEAIKSDYPREYMILSKLLENYSKLCIAFGRDKI